MDIRQRYIDHMKEAMKTNGINARELAKRKKKTTSGAGEVVSDFVL